MGKGRYFLVCAPLQNNRRVPEQRIDTPTTLPPTTPYKRESPIATTHLFLTSLVLSLSSSFSPPAPQKIMHGKMSWLTRNLALAAAVALTTATFSAQSLPLGRRALDACGILGGLNATQIRPVDVANCYNAIPFDRSVASSTFQTVYKLYNEMYVFRDSALTPDLPLPFTSPPVDIVKELQTIGTTNYKSDYAFHRDLALAIASLNDAHASYSGRNTHHLGFPTLQLKLEEYYPCLFTVRFPSRLL